MSKNGLDALLRPEDSIVVLIDHQPFQFACLKSHEPTMIMNNVVGLAKAAKVFDVPTILTTVLEERGGYLIKELQAVFPEQKPIDRTFINTWEDAKVTDIVKKSGRKQLVLAGLYTEICLAMPAATMRRTAMSCASSLTPITWFAIMSEWQRDYARESTLEGVTNIIHENGGAASVALSWETQLLTAPRAKS